MITTIRMNMPIPTSTPAITAASVAPPPPSVVVMVVSSETVVSVGVSTVIKCYKPCIKFEVANNIFVLARVYFAQYYKSHLKVW